MRRLELNHVGWRSDHAVARRSPGGADDRKAINGGFDLLDAERNRCYRVSLVPLRAIK